MLASNNKKEVMQRGIVIIATKSPIYGKMAYNLALTIKATGSKIPVALIHDKEAIDHLKIEHLNLFDQLIPSEWNWNKIRFNIDKLTPFDHTMQLDADMLWLWKDPAEVFELAGDSELLVTNEGVHDLSTGEEKMTGNYGWLADFQETVNAYKLKGNIYMMRWELLLFRNTDKVRKMLAKAEQIWNKPKVEGVWKFEGRAADEFAFYVACCHYGMDQVLAPFIPAYWCRKEWNPTVAEIDKKYHAISFGGNTASKQYQKIYDIILQVACNKIGLPYSFRLQSKRTHLTSRITV
jgi:hypothetical protein